MHETRNQIFAMQEKEIKYLQCRKQEIKYLQCRKQEIKFIFIFSKLLKKTNSEMNSVVYFNPLS